MNTAAAIALPNSGCREEIPMQSQLERSICIYAKDQHHQQQRRKRRETIQRQIAERTKKPTNVAMFLFMEMVAHIWYRRHKASRSSKTTCHHHIQWTPTILLNLSPSSVNPSLSLNIDR
jgi:hypothetical protein